MRIRYAILKSKIRSQKGIAIVFVLGILGLLTVIGLGFASSALLDKQISNNTTGVEGARLLSKSGFERAFALLKAGASVENIVSRSGSSDHDFLWKLNTVMDGLDVFFLGRNYNPADTTQPGWIYVENGKSGTEREIVGRFAYIVTSGHGKLDPSVHLGNPVGAFASGATPANSHRFGTAEWEIDFRNALVASPETLSNTHFQNITRFLYDSTSDSASSPANPHFENPSRFYDLPSFVVVANGSSGTAVTADGEADLNKHTEFLQSPASESFWIDVSGEGKQTSDEFFHRFNLARIDYDNSYFDDVNIFFGMKKNGTAYEKVTGKDGGTYDYNARPFSEKLEKHAAGTPPAGTPADADMCLDTGGLQWLGKWEDNPATLPDAWTDSLKRKQVAANIIQYCRKDTSRTVTNLDASVSDWVESGAEPLYAGNGKHPLINEVAMKASVAGAVTETTQQDADSIYNWKYEITLDFGTELIDIYDIAAKRNAEVYFAGYFACSYFDLSSGEYKDLKLEINKENGKIEIKPDAASAHWGSNGYTAKTAFWQGAALSTTLPEGSFTGAAGKTAEHENNLKLQNVRLVIEKVYLKYADSATPAVMRDRDFAKIGKTFNVETNAGSGPDAHVAVKIQQSFYGAAATEDPRVNHYPENWLPLYSISSGSVTGANTDHEVTVNAGTTDEFAGAGAGLKTTLGEKNLTLALSGASGEDKETATDPALGTISTAFIAEKPMLSLWVLGAISRAEKWRTVNLKATVPHSAGKTNLSGGKDTVMTFGAAGYQAGDGNILDQVKINEIAVSPVSDADKGKIERTASYGKVNINSSVHNVLRAIYQNVKFNNVISSHYRFDRSSSDPGSNFYTLSCTGRNSSDTADELHSDTCIACAVKAQENPAGRDMQYRTRADLLLPAHTQVLEHLKISGPAAGENDAEQEQITGKTMNLLKADAMDQAYVIVVAQTIKEAKVPAGQTMYVDWNRDGNYSTVSINGITDVPVSAQRGPGTAILAAKNAGYLRTPMISELTNNRTLYGCFFGNEPSLSETVTKTAGTYCNGIDRITSTVKLVVLLEKDAVSGMWKIVRYEYVD